jgi:hypothetical protein
MSAGLRWIVDLCRTVDGSSSQLKTEDSGRHPVRRLLTMVFTLTGVATVITLPAGPSFGAVSGGDGPGGTVNVGASSGGSTGPLPGGLGGPGGTGTATGGAGSPWSCTYLKLLLNDEGGIAPGGPTPGSWYSMTCTNAVTGASFNQTLWIADQAPSPGTPAVDPHALALQAERSLQLPAPAMHFNPSETSVVNLPTWLWVDTSIWHPFSVTASAGSVSATAVASPASVTWTTGDGGVVVCDGPGVPFDGSLPASGQTTDCAHVYRVSSAGQPAPDGDPNDASFAVVATVSWSVRWTALGAPGGGSLPALTTSSSAGLRVQQVESILSSAFSTGSRRPAGRESAL